MSDLTAYIRERAAELGFAAAAITGCEPLESAGARLDQWVDAAYMGTMDWMVRTVRERRDPRAFFPEGRSAVVVALNYYRETEAIDRPAEDGNISIYARGRDYHKVMRGKLKRLLRDIRERQPDRDVRGRICVDSFPLMEKPLAVRAGIGWIGKHTNLIIKGKGSWVFLGELLLDIDLPPDAPFTADHCGTCNRCQVACPTGALDTPYLLDARRCISYLTIEHDGEITPDLAEGMGNWVFGCDICQAVCPWNRFSTHTAERDFDNRLPDHLFDIRRLGELSQGEFERLFEGTPVRRSGYANFRRNLAIAAANRDRGDG